jgi:hypothetical protein
MSMAHTPRMRAGRKAFLLSITCIGRFNDVSVGNLHLQLAIGEITVLFGPLQ